MMEVPTFVTELLKKITPRNGIKTLCALGLTILLCLIFDINSLLFCLIFIGWILFFELCIFIVGKYSDWETNNDLIKEKNKLIDILFYTMSEEAKFNALQIIELPLVRKTRYLFKIEEKKCPIFDYRDYRIETSFNYKNCIKYREIGNSVVIEVDPYLYKLLKKEQKKRNKNKQ